MAVFCPRLADAWVQKLNGSPWLLHPGNEFLEDGPGMGLVADEIVVADKNFSPPPQVKEGVQLGQHLIGAFITGLAAVKVDDIAELAIERTAPGGLDAHDDVIVQIQQVKAGHRRAGSSPACRPAR